MTWYKKFEDAYQVISSWCSSTLIRSYQIMITNEYFTKKLTTSWASVLLQSVYFIPIQSYVTFAISWEWINTSCWITVITSLPRFKVAINGTDGSSKRSEGQRMFDNQLPRHFYCFCLTLPIPRSARSLLFHSFSFSFIHWKFIVKTTEIFEQ